MYKSGVGYFCNMISLGSGARTGMFSSNHGLLIRYSPASPSAGMWRAPSEFGRNPSAVSRSSRPTVKRRSSGGTRRSTPSTRSASRAVSVGVGLGLIEMGQPPSTSTRFESFKMRGFLLLQNWNKRQGDKQGGVHFTVLFEI